MRWWKPATADERRHRAGCVPPRSRAASCASADMIAYVGKDRYDAHRAWAWWTRSTRSQSDYLGRDNARIINNLTVDIVNDELRDRPHRALRGRLQRPQAVRSGRTTSSSTRARAWRATTGNVVGAMFEELYARLLGGSSCAGDEGSPVFQSPRAQPWPPRSRHHERPRSTWPAEPNQIVVDYLASMTDRYFTSLFAHLFPEKPPAHRHPRLLRRPGMSRKRKPKAALGRRTVSARRYRVSGAGALHWGLPTDRRFHEARHRIRPARRGAGRALAGRAHRGRGARPRASCWATCCTTGRATTCRRATRPGRLRAC